MARKTNIVRCEIAGRDHGKQFFLTELPASQAEEWAMRCFLALAHSGVQVPEDLADSGIAGIAVVGLQALARIPFEEAKPLLDQMMSCVQYMPDPSKPLIVRAPMEEDIEEASTRIWLRGEVFELHTGFSVAGAIMTFQQAPADQEQTSNPMSMFRRQSV